MKIVVLVKQVPDTGEERSLDPVSGRVDREASDPIIDEISERALEAALSVKDRDKSTEVVVLSMGPSDAAKAIRKALSMGADAGIHVLDDALEGADAMLTAQVLAAALRNADADLVITGNESTDGRGGIIPAMLAEHLNIPLLGSLNTVNIDPVSITGQRRNDEGTQDVSADLPAIISVTESFAEARFPNFKGIMGAKRKPVSTLAAAELGVNAMARTSISNVETRAPRSAGTTIIDEGQAAAQLVDFLTTQRLI